MTRSGGHHEGDKIYMVERVASGAIAASASWPYNVFGRTHSQFDPSVFRRHPNMALALPNLPTSQSSLFLLVSNGVVLPAPRYVTR